jgi:hypothetical protein
MADPTDVDARTLPVGARRGGWSLVGKVFCPCGQHEQEPFVAIWRKRSAFLLLRHDVESGRYEQITHEAKAAFGPMDWMREVTILWGDLANHPLELEARGAPPRRAIEG